jgi:hypothetical protein
LSDSEGPDGDDLNIPALPASEREALRYGGKSDKRADAEAESLSADLTEDELASRARRNEHRWQQIFKATFEILVLATLIVLFIAFFMIGVVWLIHMIVPQRYRWLTCDQVTILQDILTGGIVAGLVGEHFKRRIGR